MMQNNFKIAKYKQTDSGYERIGYDEYQITYLKGTRTHQLRVVVNKQLTKQTINLIDFSKGYKQVILSAISEYVNGPSQSNNQVTKFLKLSYIKQFYSKSIVKNVENYLLNISKEENRDVLTKFKLI